MRVTVTAVLSFGCLAWLAAATGCGPSASQTQAIDAPLGNPIDAPVGGVDARPIHDAAPVPDGHVSADAAAGCGLVTCNSIHATCGPIGDGCGGTLQCGDCPAPTTCGGGDTPSQCGGTAQCVALTCNDLGFACGPAGDGCGHMLDCGDCTLPETCGGGGTRGMCGGDDTADAGAVVSTCVPMTCDDIQASCGMIADGCGNMVDCGDCTLPETCGGGGETFQCGQPTCVPQTCAQLGFDCGAAGDGCGNLIPNGCGSCTLPDVCGGEGFANQCGNGFTTGGSHCDGGQTTIVGTVVAGTDSTLMFGNPDPIYGATVYIPSGAVDTITTGATCDQCSTHQASLVSFVTGIDGKFTLTNPPTGPNVTLVIQLGKWRRVLTLDVIPCTQNNLTTTQTRLPRKQHEFNSLDNIPRFAISTGDVDAMECVLRKMGIADTEFTDPQLDGSGVPQAAGRVHIYQATYDSDNGAGGAIMDDSTPDDSALWANSKTINSYDAVLFPCTGGEDDKDPESLSGDPSCPGCVNAQANVIDYADLGGRIFATHFSYVWLFDDPPWGCGSNCTTANQTTADWDPDTLYDPDFTGYIDQTFAKGAALAEWLQQAAVGASTTQGQIPVQVVRRDFKSLVGGSQRWMYAQDPPDSASFPMHYTFNTPANATPANQCGRVVFSDFHVENIGSATTPGSYNDKFPKECDGDSPMTPQEKLLEFMLFDLTSCVAPDVATCAPQTCMELGYGCGMQGDGCGATLNCGMCPAGETCGGGGVPNQCGGACAPLTCASQGLMCGQTGDGCGHTLDCGDCTAPDTCGGGGISGQCGLPMDGAVCMPLTCPEQNIACGGAGDGCGTLLACGMCPPGQTCGGGGTPGQCGAPSCTPRTCADAMANCGTIGDGCGGTMDCGMCTLPATCGGSGVPNQCGSLG